MSCPNSMLCEILDPNYEVFEIKMMKNNKRMEILKIIKIDVLKKR
jgi:hypothetical protein